MATHTHTHTQGNRTVSANQNDWLGPRTPLDLRGVDYGTPTYDVVHALAPSIPMISSETSSAVSDRGEYKNDKSAGHVTGYDTEHPSWGQTAEGAWGGIGQLLGQGILTREYMSGGFTWTGFDYKGEPTPYEWPDINSHFGVLDIAGFEKDRFYWYKAWFGRHAATGSDSVLHVFPHWNWGGGHSTGGERENAHLARCEGLCDEGRVDVWAFTNGASVELLVNGKSFGVVNASTFAHAQWPKVTFVPGAITAVARDAHGQVVAQQTVETTGAATALRATIRDGVGNATADGHGGGIVAGCSDVALVEVDVVDDSGRVVPTASHPITLDHTGEGGVEYIGGGNGDPACHVSDKNATRPAFHGKVLGVFQSTSSAPGIVRVTASSPGLKPSTLSLRVVPPTFDRVWWCRRLEEI
jgi:beta-galactosidase